MSYRLPPWIRPPPEDIEPPSGSSYLEASSSMAAGMEEGLAVKYEQQSAYEAADETYGQPRFTIAGMYVSLLASIA